MQEVSECGLIRLEIAKFGYVDKLLRPNILQFGRLGGELTFPEFRTRVRN